MNCLLSSGKRLANGRETVKECRTMSCSSSAVNEDGEVEHSGGISLITELAPGRLTLIGGSSEDEASIADLGGNEGDEGGRRRRRGFSRKEGANFRFQIQKSEVKHRFRNLLWPWIKWYSAANDHSHCVKSLLTTTKSRQSKPSPIETGRPLEKRVNALL